MYCLSTASYELDGKVDEAIPHTGTVLRIRRESTSLLEKATSDNCPRTGESTMLRALSVLDEIFNLKNLF